MRKIHTLVVHTAASERVSCPEHGIIPSGREFCPEDVSNTNETASRICRVQLVHTPVYLTVEEVDRYHRNDRGFTMIGYHEYITQDGTAWMGRPIWMEGAGVRGGNANTYHICMSGHGDLEPFTKQQMYTLFQRHKALVAQVGLVQVVGHRELLTPGVSYKSCPGIKVDMNALRAYLFSPPIGG